MASAFASQAQNLVTNGSFDQVANSSGTLMTAVDNYLINASSNGNWGYNIVGWSNSSYVGVVYGSGIADSASNTPLYAAGHNPQRLTSWYLRGSQDGLASDASFIVPASSPDGGNFFGADGNFAQGPLTQTVSGFVVGQTYTLSFWSAGAELGTGGGTSLTAGWGVTLKGGSTTDVNTSVTTPSYRSQGFSPWFQTVITFTASSASEVLTFNPTGTGSPPMSLLDGIAILPGSNVVPAVPEPAEWALMGVGLLIVGARLRSRRRKGA